MCFLSLVTIMKAACAIFRHDRVCFLCGIFTSHFSKNGFYTSLPKKSSEKEDLTAALFVPGNKAETVASVVTPHLEFSKQIENEITFRNNIAMRGMNVDVSDITRKWTAWKDIKSRRAEMEEKKSKIAKAIKALEKNHKKKASLDEMKEQGRKLRNEANSLAQQIRNLEETAVVPLLQLPNCLHHMTPHEEKLLFSFSEKPTFTFSPRSHKELGKITGELEFMANSPTSYYLRNNLSLLELVTTDHFLSILRAESYLPTCNSDFVKAAVLEGSGVHYLDRHRLNKLRGQEGKKEEDPLHLVGGGSLPAFVAYVTKQMVEKGDTLPQKFVTAGRNYQARGNECLTLFGCKQSTVVDGLILYSDTETLDEKQILDEALILLIRSFSTMGLHFRVVQYSGDSLKMYESGAVGIEMYSPAADQYQEVGRISLCGDYISRRLWTMYKIETEKSLQASYP